MENIKRGLIGNQDSPTISFETENDLEWAKTIFILTIDNYKNRKTNTSEFKQALEIFQVGISVFLQS